MKKIAALLLTLLMVVSLAACTGNSEAAESSSADVESSTSGETSVSDSSTVNPDAVQTSETEDEAVQASGTESEAVQTSGTGSEAAEKTDSGIGEDAGNGIGTDEVRVLVAYFSATNTTEGVAEYVAEVLGADLYEIVPEEPYTDADLDYNDNNSRTTIEMNDSSARPEISGSVEAMEQYDIVVIGYPIWWGDAPRIISTFMESYDFTGKTVVPFCTSASSGIASSVSNLEQLTSGAQWLSGQRFSGSSSRDEIAEWVNGLGLDVTAE